MVNQSLMERITKELFTLKREYEKGRIVISHKIPEANQFARDLSYKKIGTFNIDDPLVVSEVRQQLERHKYILIIAYVDIQEYEVYTH